MSRQTGSASTVSALPPAEASLADVGRALRRHWRWVVIPTALAFVASVLFVLLVPPRYTGEARLLLQAGDTYLTRLGNERPDQAPQIDEQAVASQVQVVMSRDLARKAIQRLGLVGNPEFDPEAEGAGLWKRIAAAVGLTPDSSKRPPEDRVLDQYYDHLLVYPVGKSRIVAIEFRAKDADLAARGANTVAELYLDLQEEAKKGQFRDVSTSLGSNLEALRKAVQDAEGKVETFRAKTGLLVGSGTITLSAQQLSELSGQLAQARTAQSDSQAKAKLIKDLIRDGRAFEIPDVANNELVRRVLEQRVNLKAQLALELRTLMPQHPRIKELNAQLSDLETQLRSAADRTVRTLENDSRIAGGRVDSLVAAVDAQKKIVAQANEGEVQLRALEREARIQREQLEGYLGRYREAKFRNEEFGMPPDARIVSRSIVPQIPSFPKKLPIVALATLAAFVLSIGSIMARELLAAGPASAAPGPVTYDLADPAPEAAASEPSPPAKREDAQLTFDLSHLRPTQSPPLMAVAESIAPMQAVVEAAPQEAPEQAREQAPPPAMRAYDFRQLAARLSRAEVGERGRRILVRPVEGREDGEHVARGLAQLLAVTSRVILITADADEDQPVEDLPGLTDLITGEASFAEAIRRDRDTDLHVVGPGTLVNEAITSNAEGLEIALAAFEETYDWVICALLGTEVDELARPFAPRVDAVVIASDLDASHPDLVHAFTSAKEAGARDLVVVREEAEGLHAAA